MVKEFPEFTCAATWIDLAVAVVIGTASLVVSRRSWPTWSRR